MNHVDMPMDGVLDGAGDVRVLLGLAQVDDQAATMVDGIMWARLRAMRGHLHRIFSGSGSDLLVAAAKERYGQLMPAHQARVLLSSEFCDRQMAWSHAWRRKPRGEGRGASEQVGPLRDIFDMLCREHAIAGLLGGSTGEHLRRSEQWQVYSPAGDVVAVKGEDGHWRLESLPTIGGCVAVDFDSPSARLHEPRSGILSQPCLPFLAAERTALLEKLERALGLIDACEPFYGQLIRTFVRRIIVRKSQSDGDAVSLHYGSEHAPRHPGSLRLLNFHRSQVSVEASMESLMHESTHNFLAAWELSQGFLAGNDDSVRVISPWSGNPIPASSFIHAVFVYYICHRLHEQRLQREQALSPAVRGFIEGRLAVCAAGFLIARPLSSLLPADAALRPGIAALLDEMQAGMRGQYAAKVWA